MDRILCIAAFATLATGCVLLDDSPPPSRGFALSWRLVDAREPDPLAAPSLTCSEAGVTTVLVDAFDIENNGRYRTEFTCDTLDGVTEPMPRSQYQVLLIARAKDGTARS